MRFLSWHRVAANHHELRDVDDTVWADVQPYTEARKGAMKACALHPDLPVTKYGPWWTTGANVAGARNNIARWISEHTWERFKIVPADEQQDRQQEEDDAAAAVAEAINAAAAAAEAERQEKRAARMSVRARREALAAAQFTFAF